MVKPIYQGRVVTLNVDTVRLPNGHTIDLEVIRHPGASAVVPMKEDGTVVLIRQFRQSCRRFQRRSRRPDCIRRKEQPYRQQVIWISCL